MTAKRSRGEIRSIVESYGYKLIKYFYNNVMWVHIKDKFGYKYCVVLSTILNHKPYIVHKSNPYSLRNISLWLLLNKKSFKLSKANVYIGNKVPLLFKCSICKGKFKKKWNSVMDNEACPYCSSSKGEIKIKSFLDECNIDYLREFKIPNCVNKFPLPFDFAIFDKSEKLYCLLEYDGILHYEDKFENQREFKLTKKRDKIKTKYCKDNNIKLIRIPYWEFSNIETLLAKNLFMQTDFYI